MLKRVVLLVLGLPASATRSGRAAVVPLMASPWSPPSGCRNLISGIRDDGDLLGDAARDADPGGAHLDYARFAALADAERRVVGQAERPQQRAQFGVDGGVEHAGGRAHFELGQFA